MNSTFIVECCEYWLWSLRGWCRSFWASLSSVQAPVQLW